MSFNLWQFDVILKCRKDANNVAINWNHLNLRWDKRRQRWKLFPLSCVRFEKEHLGSANFLQIKQNNVTVRSQTHEYQFDLNAHQIISGRLVGPLSAFF